MHLRDKIARQSVILITVLGSSRTSALSAAAIVTVYLIAGAAGSAAMLKPISIPIPDHSCPES
jgi:hypothetical protein